MSQTFGFSTNEVVIAKNGKTAISKDKGVIVLQKQGNKWIAQLTIGDTPGPIAHLTSLEALNSIKGFPYVKGVSNDLSFEINDSQTTILTGNIAIVFREESLKSDYKTQFTSLLAELDYKAPNNSNAPKSTKGSNNSTNTLLPTSGNLTPLTFAKHPFGFMPQGSMTQSDACHYLQKAGWPSKPYDSTMISIISATAFKIPFKMYGKDISNMAMFWHNGKNSSYDLEISDFTSNWNKNDAIELARKIYDDLIKNGYSRTEVKYKSSTNFYQEAVTNGSVYIEISSMNCSKLASYDSFGIRMKVQYQSK